MMWPLIELTLIACCSGLVSVPESFFMRAREVHKHFYSLTRPDQCFLRLLDLLKQVERKFPHQL